MAFFTVCSCLFSLAYVASDGPGLFGQEALKVKFEFDKGASQLDITVEEEYSASASAPHTDGLRRKRATHGFRPGHSTTTNTCNHVRGVPDNLRQPDVMRPDGLSDFYQKYTETYGIPVLGSSQVSDDALKRACYTVRFMLADHAGIRESYYKLSGRVAIMAATEVTKDIPEHSHLDDSMNQRARGLGATITAPVSTGAEENVLCQSNDRYHPEDIFLQSFALAINSLGASIVIPDWTLKLQETYDHAISTGLWENTFAITNPSEYFAEGVQSFFSVNDHANPANGIHNDIDTHAELRNYDRQLFDLISSVFPCNNQYLKRCDSNREQEQAQHLAMDCNTDSAVFPESSSCQDERVECLGWAKSGECESNPGYMRVHCRAGCHVCTPEPASANCSDESTNCPGWASTGECQANPGYMLIHCKYSCDACTQQGDCTDSNTNCPGWAATGECQVNPTYMLDQCKLSCNACQENALIGR